jgi:hypothetical protein
MWEKTEDGSIVDTSGKVIYFSATRFVRDICEGNCCFICGAKPTLKKFNDEHVLPKWLLRLHTLHSNSITLSNEAHHRYASLTIPCCADCNTLMGREIEEPIRDVVSGGIESINQLIEAGGLLKLYVWLGLIFLKAHLKDRQFRFHLDARRSDHRISDFHRWEDLHHIHCVVRCFFNGCEVTQGAIGSFLSMPVRQECSPDTFDFANYSDAQTLLLRSKDAAVIAVFNDSGGAMSRFSVMLDRIRFPVSELQLSEIAVELALLNLHLKIRPSFQSLIDLKAERYRIIATRPELCELREIDLSVRGALLHRAVSHAIPSLRGTGRTKVEITNAIKSGNFSFLFDDDGQFIEKTLLTRA